MTTRHDQWIVVIAGSRWDEVAGTDKQFTLALSERVEVLWVDPATSAARLVGPGAPLRGLHEVAPHVHRLQPIAPPAATRPGVRRVSTRAVHLQVARELRRRGVEPIAVMVTGPRVGFLPGVGGARVLLATDDWVAGAPMMGLSTGWVADQVAALVRDSHVVAAVSPELADTLRHVDGGSDNVHVLPNGTDPLGLRPQVQRESIAGLVGHLNERLDYAAVTGIADRGVRVRVIGPETARDPAVVEQLRVLRDHPNVEWMGRVPREELVVHLARIGVGITPYLDNPFNRASFPLKTLEYLGAGLPVVASDLPSARWLATEHVRIAPDAGSFADLVVDVLDRAPDRDAEQRRVEFAREHSWFRRADQLMDLITSVPA